MDNFDVNKELDAMMANIKAERNAPAQQTRPTQTQPQPRPTQQRPTQPKNDTAYYSGEVYFAAKRPAAETTVEQQPVRRPATNVEGDVAVKRRRQVKKKKVNPKATAIYIAALIVISIFLSLYTMSFVNDILAFNRSTETVTVSISENATTGKVINQLKKAGLIKHKYLCKMFMTFTKDLHGSKPTYLSGVYYLSPSMGLEKMLLSCQETQKADTVTVTIPEGYNIRQIATKLEKAGVCMSDEFLKNVNSATFSYSFVTAIENKSARYFALEGYLYPDTYEFYVGASASSVINKMLENFNEKWTDEYQARADAMGWTVDEVLTLASIVQKEAADADQMPTIARIFINRINSNSFRRLQSNTTSVYLKNYVKPYVSSGEYDVYWAKYSTYDCVGLPVGPICSPGDDAIRAVLWPGDNNYYYFCHDSKGNIYCASTGAEHDANVIKAATAS